MPQPSNTSLSTIAVTVTLLAILPLFGLAWGLLNPPVNPFIPYRPSLLELVQQSHASTLLINTLMLALLVSLLAGSIGTWLAWVNVRCQYLGRRYLAVLDLLPLAMPSYILATTLRENLGPGGGVGKALGLPMFTGFFPAVIVLTLISIPYIQLLVSAALQKLSANEEDAARCLGTSEKRIFWRIIFPQLRPSFAFAWLIASLYIVSDFGAVAVLDTQVLTWRLYQAVEHQQLAKAALLGMVLLMVTIPLLIFARTLHGKVPRIASVSNPRPSMMKTLSPAALTGTYLLHAVLIGMGVILPVLTLTTWVYQGWLHNLPFAPLWQPIRDTLWLSLLSGIGIIVLALVPAWTVARRLLRFPHFIEQGIYLTNSLPGILLAFGLLLFALALADSLPHSIIFYQWLLGSGILLFLGYLMRFIAEGYAGLKSAILLFDPRLGESARLLNAGRWRYLRDVFIPGIRPGIAAAFILVMLSLVKELPITLLLGGPMGIRTLSFRVFDRYQEAFLHDVGSAGLLLLLLSMLLVFMVLRQRQVVM